jgi:hypothetical protein
MKKLLIICLLLGLAGCSTFSKTAIISEKTVNLDARVLEQCKDIPLVDAQATWNDILTNHKNIVEQYYDCRQKQANSTKLLKEIGNIK